ncbi:MAG TPA: thioredoxin family protein [Fimbriimonas sp.]|nr:thioredoxin family protein [Fimbriimonas sp.]
MIVTALLLLDITSKLTPVTPSADTGNLRWSPKGATVELVAAEASLKGEFPLGLPGAPKVKVELTKTDGAEHFDRLSVDLNRNGKFDDKETVETKPTLRNGNWWSSFTTPDIQIPLGKGGVRSYPISFWFVFDPAASDAKPTLRWSRRGWHEGTAQIEGKTAHVLVTEMVMDGVFDQRDAWFLARDRKALLGAMSRQLQDHAWLDGKAYRLTHLDPDGLNITFETFDPGMSEADELAKRDLYADDKAAPRAPTPLQFLHSYEEASKESSKNNKLLLIDFETTWCGPCKQMDELVYTAQSVVTAGDKLVRVKVDGDQRKDLTKKFNVGAYPTMIILDAKGKELRRVVGYQSVAAMTDFLKR